MATLVQGGNGLRRLAWVLLAVGALATLGPRFCRYNYNDHLCDFVLEWASARNFFTGLPVYERQEVSLYHHMGLVRKPGEFFLEINGHPPTSVLVALPFAALPFRQALLVWNFLSLLALGASILLVFRELKIPFTTWSLVPTGTLILLSGIYGPLREQMIQGQWNLFLLLLVTAVWASSRNDRPVLAGILLGLATMIKLYPGLLFVYFLLQRQWRTLLAGVLSSVVLTGITVLTLGLDSYQRYLFEGMPYVAQFGSAWPGISLKSFWLRLFNPTQMCGGNIPLVFSPLLAQVLTVLSCGLVLLAWGRVCVKAQTPAQRDHAFALCLVAMLLVSPIAWDHYLVILLMPMVYFWTALRTAGPVRWVLIVFLIPLVCHREFFWIPLLYQQGQSWIELVAQPWQTLTILAVYTYALLGLFVVGLVSIPRPLPSSSHLTSFRTDTLPSRIAPRHSLPPLSARV